MEEEFRVSKRRIAWYTIALVLIVAALGCYVSYVGLVKGWLEKPAEILDADNVESEYEWFHNRRRGLEAMLANILIVESQMTTIGMTYGLDRSKWPLTTKEEYSQLGGLKVQQETAYHMACSEYQARWDNVFHSVVAPRDIPRSCYMLE